MSVAWLPFACTDPMGDAYYNCFTQPNLGSIPDGGVPVGTGGDDAGDAGAPNDAGTDDGGAAADAGVMDDGGAAADGSSEAGAPACVGLAADAGVPPPVVSSFQFTVPRDSVARHPPVPGAVAPYGLEILFNVACAGQVNLVPLDPANGNPQQIPVECVDSSGQPRGSDDYVFGFTRVYAYEADSGITNTNPVVSGVDFPDPAPDGGAWPTCFQAAPPSYTTGVLEVPACPPKKGCPGVKLGPIVPSTSQETDPQNNRRELLWVDYYSTFGSISGSAKLLYDPSGANLGGLAKSDSIFTPPAVSDLRDGYVFMVVHDNRGGASWVTVPVHLE
jgi:hypothetical protein